MKILVTGFEPFPNEDVNPSWEVGGMLTEYRLDGVEIIAKRLPIIYSLAAFNLQRYLIQEKPDIFVGLGQAQERTNISLERVGLNIREASIPDNHGYLAQGEPIIQGAPVAYFSNFNLGGIVKSLQKNGIPACISNTAGTYVCNEILFSALHHQAQFKTPSLAGFVHIPLLPEQAVSYRNMPSMSLKVMSEALHIIIKELCCQYSENK